MPFAIQRHRRVNSSQPIPLRLILVVPFLIQIILTVGLTGLFSWRNGQKAINVLATQLETEVSDRIDQHLNSHLKEYEQLPLVECYPGQLNQVFMNVLTNAIDAIEERNTTLSD